MTGKTNKPTVLVMHGPNLNMLGTREPEIYGRETLDDINNELIRHGATLGIEITTFQSNHEGQLVDRIHEAVGRIDGLIVNPGAYTHTSVALRDAILLLNIPVAEVHLSNIYKREPFRHKSLLADIVTGQISGFGSIGYRLALDAIAPVLEKK